MKPDYARTTITVPWELKSRMKRAGSRVNWSSVACEAFEGKLEELGPIEEITTLDETVERMKSLMEARGAKRKSHPENCVDGEEAGKQWAMNSARPGQLKRIAKLKSEQESPEQWEELMMSRRGWLELTECLLPPGKRNRGGRHKGPGKSHESEMECDGPRGGRHSRRRPHGPRRGGPDKGFSSYMQTRNVWRTILDERPEHDEFYLGFANGAIEVWDQIKDQLG